MLFFSTTTLIALLGCVAAAPTNHNLRGYDNCPDGMLPNGDYADQGCGTVVHPGGVTLLCLRTAWDTKEGSPLALGPCISDNITGGRWKLTIGGSQIVNKQANVGDMCLSATADYAGLEMSKCLGATRQSWTVTRTTIKLTERNLCLESDVPASSGASATQGKVRLAPCVAGKKAQTWDIPGPYSFYD